MSSECLQGFYKQILWELYSKLQAHNKESSPKSLNASNDMF